MKQLAELKQKNTELLELNISINTGVADLAIQTPDAESHPLIQLVKEEAISSARRVDEIARIGNDEKVERLICLVSTG